MLPACLLQNVSYYRRASKKLELMARRKINCLLHIYSAGEKFCNLSRELSRVCDKITNIGLKTMILRVSTLVRRKEEKKKSGLTKNRGESCEICRTTAKGLAEFNRQLLCTRCFERMIKIRVGGEANIPEGILDTSSRPPEEENILLAV